MLLTTNKDNYKLLQNKRSSLYLNRYQLHVVQHEDDQHGPDVGKDRVFKTTCQVDKPGFFIAICF